MKVLVTGGTGYIGSHTIIDLLEHGYEVVSLDNFSRSDGSALDRIEAITGKRVQNYEVDLCSMSALRRVFEDHPDFTGIIHFAAFKSVPESVEEPLLYYRNNLGSLVNILQCVEDYGVRDFVFSSSCSVYGNTTDLPVTEETALPTPESPYAYTKQIGEQSITDIATRSSANYILLRYFNPVGAHASGLNGEVVIGPPANLIPAITQFAAGRLPKLTVFGTDYDTRDGSCLRDFIHVMDIAHGHTKALEYLAAGRNDANCEVFNLGTGEGVTVLEAIRAFEAASGMKLDVTYGPRRPGDVIKIYADNSLARERLGWSISRGIEEMMGSAWKWEQKLEQMRTATAD